VNHSGIKSITGSNGADNLHRGHIKPEHSFTIKSMYVTSSISDDEQPAPFGTDCLPNFHWVSRAKNPKHIFIRCPDNIGERHKLNDPLVLAFFVSKTMFSDVWVVKN